MVVLWSTLPPELWSNVFRHVQCIETLAECRLVCKTWDPIAERAMFSSSITDLNSLHLGYLSRMPPTVLKGFFKLVMNPNIVSLNGILDETALNCLLNAVKESGEQCNKLTSLITSSVSSYDGYSYLSAQLYFKTSLQEVHLFLDKPHTPIYQTVVNHLEEFNHLKKLFLSYSERHILPELEQMLTKCHHLETLHFDISMGETEYISKEDLQKWMKYSVQKQSSTLRFIDISDIYHPHLIEYLMFKYSTDDLMTVKITGARTDNHGTIGRILDAIKNVPCIDVSYWYLDKAEEVEQTLSMLKDRNNVVILRPCKSIYLERFRVRLDANRYRHNNTTQYKIDISEDEFSVLFDRIINTIGSLQNLKVNYVDEDIISVYWGMPYQRDRAFRRMIDIITVAMDVCFTCVHIPYPSFSVDPLLSPQLTTLKICGAIVDQRVLTILSKVAPKLKHLTLNSCILNPAFHHHYQINMPVTNFGTLCIISGDSIWEDYDDMDNPIYGFESRPEAIKKINRKISITHDQMVILKITSLSSNQVQHYILTPWYPAVVKTISKDEYTTCCAFRWPNIIIECNSLQTLRLDLGALFVELNPNLERPVEDDRDWTRSVDAALLKELYDYEQI
ncbi:hypothetical protein MBANPS3_004072 [Mucor bainieri]